MKRLTHWEHWSYYVACRPWLTGTSKGVSSWVTFNRRAHIFTVQKKKNAWSTFHNRKNNTWGTIRPAFGERDKSVWPFHPTDKASKVENETYLSLRGSSVVLLSLKSKVHLFSLLVTRHFQLETADNTFFYNTFKIKTPTGSNLLKLSLFSVMTFALFTKHALQ